MLAIASTYCDFENLILIYQFKILCMVGEHVFLSTFGVKCYYLHFVFRQAIQIQESTSKFKNSLNIKLRFCLHIVPTYLFKVCFSYKA